MPRGPIQEKTGEPLDDKYFTQTLLPDFMNNNPELTASWDVVYMTPAAISWSRIPALRCRWGHWRSGST